MPLVHIRPEQLAALGEEGTHRFAHELVARVQRRDTEQADPERAREIVTHVMAKAERWGIDYESDVEELLDWCLALGLDFEQRPGLAEVREIFEDPSLPGFAKIDVVRMELGELGR